MKSHHARGMSRKWATGETFLVSSPSRGRDGIRSVADGPRRKRTSVAPKVGGSIWKFKSPKCWKREQRYRTQAARRHSIVTDDLGRRVTLLVYGPLYPQSTQPSTRSAPCLRPLTSFVETFVFIFQQASAPARSAKANLGGDHSINVLD